MNEVHQLMIVFLRNTGIRLSGTRGILGRIGQTPCESDATCVPGRLGQLPYKWDAPYVGRAGRQNRARDDWWVGTVCGVAGKDREGMDPWY